MAMEDPKFIQLLTTIGVSPLIAKVASNPLRAAMAMHDIISDNRIAGFLGQLMTESVKLTHLEENLNYTTLAALKRSYGKRMEGRTDLLRNPKGLAIVAYGGRLGNAKAPSTDGWDYRGSGLIQTTGRTNFTLLEKGTGLKVVANPTLLRTDWSAASISACYFFASNGCLQASDSKNWDAVTKKVNGPVMLEKEHRAAMSNRVLRELAKL